MGATYGTGKDTPIKANEKVIGEGEPKEGYHASIVSFASASETI